ncbi:MAG: hypothetical protein AAGH70_05475 [Pseudomonadota bacterium]
MLRIFAAVGVLGLSAQVASADILQCNFNPSQARGWAPEVMYFDTTRDTIRFARKEVKLSSSGSSYFWRVSLRSNLGSHQRVKYTLRVGDGAGVGRPVNSQMIIEVKGTQKERANGTCEIYAG